MKIFIGFTVLVLNCRNCQLLLCSCDACYFTILTFEGLLSRTAKEISDHSFEYALKLSVLNIYTYIIT